MQTSSVNTYTDGQGAEAVTSGVLSFNLTDSQGSLVDVSSPMVFGIPNSPLPEMTFVQPQFSENVKLFYHKVDISLPGDAVVVTLRTDNPGIVYRVYFSFGTFPTEVAYDYSTEVTSYASSSGSEMKVVIPGNAVKNNGFHFIGLKPIEGE